MMAKKNLEKGMKYIYSNSLDDIIINSFWWQNKHYTWNDIDCVYYNDNDEEDYWMTIPDNAE